MRRPGDQRRVVAGYHQDSLRSVNMRVWNWRGLDVVNAHERDPDIYVRGMRAGIDAALSGRIAPLDLLSHRYRLHELDAALNAADARPDEFIKAMVTP